MKINTKTKQNIFTEIKSKEIDCFGKLQESDFLERIINLSELPSSDPRYDNMLSDHWQHRINNPSDWDNYWFLTDERIDLINNDELFKKFVCEMLHPSVRNASESKQIKEMMNYYLRKMDTKLSKMNNFMRMVLAHTNLVK